MTTVPLSLIIDVLSLGLSRWCSDKESASQCKRLRCGFDPWVGNIPWWRKWQPTPVFLPGKSHGRKSLVDSSPWGSQKVGHDWACKLFLNSWKLKGVVTTKPLTTHYVFMTLKKLHTEERMLPGRVYAWNTFFLQKLLIIPNSRICLINTQLGAYVAVHTLMIPINENS